MLSLPNCGCMACFLVLVQYNPEAKAAALSEAPFTLSNLTLTEYPVYDGLARSERVNFYRYPPEPRISNNKVNRAA